MTHEREFQIFLARLRARLTVDSEQEAVLAIFMELLQLPTRDGGAKRARGEKPPWWEDLSHEAAVFSHLARWKRGELRDPDSGVHPLVHLAWRALALAYQEMQALRAAPAAAQRP